MTVALVEGSATIGSTEYSLPAEGTTLTPQTDVCYLEGWIDFSALAAGDAYEVRVYETINGGTARPLRSWRVIGKRSRLFRLPLLLVGSGWNVTVQKTAGTDRAIAWSLRKELRSVTFDDGAATIDTTEYSLPGDVASASSQTDDVYLQTWIDFSNMAAGDRYRVRLYETINGGTQAPLFEHVLDGAQAKLWTHPLLIVGGGWNVAVTKLAGTSRSIAWSVRADEREATAPVFPVLATATTAESIRDRALDVIEDLIPEILAGDRFIRYRNESGADFRAHARANPQNMWRRVQVRHDGSGVPPPVSNTDVTEQRIQLEVIVAYQQHHRAGPDNALDRDDVMDIDRHQIEDAVGMHGRQNFSPPYPDACWVMDGSTSEVERDEGVDFVVIKQTMIFRRTQ